MVHGWQHLGNDKAEKERDVLHGGESEADVV